MTASIPPKIILSASRRTDIPAFYMDWFMAGIHKGYFEVINPYNRHRRKVSVWPNEIHSIVFWSKNYGPFLQGNFDQELLRQGYRLFFNFTINAAAPDMEPHVPPLAERLAQARELACRYDPAAMIWRFDPICFVQHDGHPNIHPPMDALESIAAPLAAAGIRRCVTSFVDLYRKVRRRLPSRGLTLVDPPISLKCDTLMAMAARLDAYQITLGACCEKTVLQALPPETGIGPGACIPGPLLTSLYGPGFALQKDPGQRRKSGCTCNIATDIGSYSEQPCYHNCLFCYANPQEPARGTKNEMGARCASAP